MDNDRFSPVRSGSFPDTSGGKIQKNSKKIEIVVDAHQKVVYIVPAFPSLRRTWS